MLSKFISVSFLVDKQKSMKRDFFFFAFSGFCWKLQRGWADVWIVMIQWVQHVSIFNQPSSKSGWECLVPWFRKESEKADFRIAWLCLPWIHICECLPTYRFVPIQKGWIKQSKRVVLNINSKMMNFSSSNTNILIRNERISEYKNVL